jgi:hypothetical protein
MIIEMISYLIIFESTLFGWGFLYGLARGREDVFWLWRSLGSGLLFALFYIAIPIIIISEKR